MLSLLLDLLSLLSLLVLSSSLSLPALHFAEYEEVGE